MATRGVEHFPSECIGPDSFGVKDKFKECVSSFLFKIWIKILYLAFRFQVLIMDIDKMLKKNLCELDSQDVKDKFKEYVSSFLSKICCGLKHFIMHFVFKY